jgi:O-antigen ligase
LINVLENSLIYRIFRKIGSGVLELIKDSFLVEMFLKNSEGPKSTTGSVFYKLYSIIRKIMIYIFHVLRLDRLLEGSVFKLVFLWMSITAVFAPLLPTSFVILMTFAGFGSLALNLFCSPRKKLQYHALNKYIYLFAAVYFVSVFTSVDVKGSMFSGCLTVYFLMFYIVVINSFNKKIQFDALVFAMTFAGILVTLYGVYQYTHQDLFGGVWVDTEMFQNISFRAYSTLENPNVLGEYYLLIIPTAVAGFFVSRKLIIKAFYFVSTALMMIGLIITYSRGCYIGILVAAAVFLVLLDKRFIILGILGLCCLPFVLPQTIINRFMSIGNMSDSSTSYRVYIWLGTIAMLKDYWLSGVGPGQKAYSKVYPYYGFNGISAPHAHNTFLQVMCDTGIAGIIMLILCIYKFFKELFISYMNQTDKRAKIYTISFISSVMGFLVQSLFDYTFYNYRVLLMFVIYLGLGVVSTTYAKLRED